MGSKFFNKVQYGLESTRGTAVAATNIWTGQSVPLSSDTRAEYPEEVFGVRAASRRSSVQQKEYRGSLNSDHAIFQQMAFPLSCGLKGGVTLAEVTSGQGDYKGTFTPSLTAANSPEAATIEIVDDVQAYEIEYAMFERLHWACDISQGNDPSPVKFDADFFGRQISAVTATGSLSLPTPTGMNGKLSRLYLDTAWAGVGGTEIASLLRSWDFEIITGLHPNHTGSAYDYFTHHSEGIIAVMLSFTVESGSVAAAKYLLQRSQTFQAARLDIVGPQIGSGTNHRLRFDVGGYFEEVSLNDGDDRGDNLSSFTLKGVYNDTGAKLIQCELTTDTATK